MEIGGYDIILENHNDVERSDLYAVAALILRKSWKDLVIENAETGKNFGIYLDDAPSIFIYKNQKFRDLWDKHGCIKRVENTMVHIFGPEKDTVTIVVDDKDNPIMKNFISLMQLFLSDVGLCI